MAAPKTPLVDIAAGQFGYLLTRSDAKMEGKIQFNGDGVAALGSGIITGTLAVEDIEHKGEWRAGTYVIDPDDVTMLLHYHLPQTSGAQPTPFGPWFSAELVAGGNKLRIESEDGSITGEAERV